MGMWIVLDVIVLVDVACDDENDGVHGSGYESWVGTRPA